MKYRADIDGLRTVAVLPVILYHAGFTLFGGGFVGVDVFFVISGYLISTIIFNELNNNNFSILRFYERRAKRILPALTVMALFTMIAVWFIYTPTDFEEFANSLTGVATFTSNIYFWMTSGYFSSDAELKPLLHTWSLAVEEQFYIFFPLLLMFMHRFKKIILVWILAISFVVSLYISQWGAYHSPESAFYLLPTRAWELLIGVFCAMYYGYVSERINSNVAVTKLLSTIGLGLIAFSVFYFDKSFPMPSVFSLVPTIGAGLVILFHNKNTLCYRLLSYRPVVYIGGISYSLYLIHQPLFSILKYRYAEQLPMLVWPAIIVTFILAHLSWKYVETPFRKSNRSARQIVLVYSPAVLLFFFCSSMILSSNAVNYGRYSNQHLVNVFKQLSYRGDYVTGDYNHHVNVNLDVSTDKEKILIVGDSFSKDLFNALNEVAFFDDKLVSTYYILASCGNLDVDENITQYRDPIANAKCGINAYKRAELINNIKAADIVYVSAEWNEWTSSFLDESINNLHHKYGNKFIVFGGKNFGHRSENLYTTEGLDGIIGNKEVDHMYGQVAKQMAQTIPGLVPYVDLQEILCGSYSRCTNQTQNGLPLSYDGYHLTPAGAKYLGDKLLSGDGALNLANERHF